MKNDVSPTFVKQELCKLKTSKATGLDGIPAMVDCEQSLFSSKIRGKERKTSKRANVTEYMLRA